MTSRRRRDRGSAGLELLALLPMLFLVASVLVQAGAAMWAASSTVEAARTGARAFALGQDPRTRVERSLPGALHLTSVQTYGPGHGVRVTVEVPRVSPLPTFRVTREAALP